jgi:hypothetical protein
MFVSTHHSPDLPSSPALLAELPRAAAAMARLDQALTGHPLRPALLYRARLEAVRRQAAVDGRSIDPWHLAAVLEGLPLRMEGALRIADRGQIVEAARCALSLHGWLAAPDFDQEGEIQAAERAIGAAGHTESPLLAGAVAFHRWLDDGRARSPMRAALVRHWVKAKVLAAPIPITGPAALGEEIPWSRSQWVPTFLRAVAREVDDYREMLRTIETAWRSARARSGARRRTSRATAAIDIMAAAPLISAKSLAAGLRMAIRNAGALLDQFTEVGIAVEVTHRSAGRLFGLTGLAPLREEVRPPYRPEPGRRPGRPRLVLITGDHESAPQPPEPFSPLEKWSYDYSELDQWMAETDRVIRETRLRLDALAKG